MRKPLKHQVWQAGCCLICFLLALRVTAGLGESEFSGGMLTGRLFYMADKGMLLFAVAFFVTFAFPRVAAGAGIAGSLLCSPLYVFFIAPVPFHDLFDAGGQFSIYYAPGLHWAKWAVAGLLACVLTLSLCVRGIALRNGEQPQVDPSLPRISG